MLVFVTSSKRTLPSFDVNKRHLEKQSSMVVVVSFEEDERLKNDDKALIRYVQPRYINQVVKEFIELVRD